MARQTRVVQIGDLSFEIQQLPAMRATLLLARVSATLTPALAKAGGAVNGGIEDLDLDALSDAARVLFEKATPAEVETVLRELFSTVFIAKGEARSPLMPEFDRYMQGEILAILTLAKEAFEVNYGDFFDAAKRMLGARKATAASKSKPPTDSATAGPASTS